MLRQKRDILDAISNYLSFQLQDCIKDDEGHFLILCCSINNATYTNITVYAQNMHQLHFLRKLPKQVNSIQQASIIWCSDLKFLRTLHWLPHHNLKDENQHWASSYQPFNSMMSGDANM